MGKVTGFLEFEREDRDYQPVAERITHWREFVVPLPEPELREQAARCMDCGVPYCHGTNTITNQPTGCPVNNQIPDWNDLIYKGKWEEAAVNLHSTNNFPEVTGRVCPAPCDASCSGRQRCWRSLTPDRFPNRPQRADAISVSLRRLAGSSLLSAALIAGATILATASMFARSSSSKAASPNA